MLLRYLSQFFYLLSLLHHLAKLIFKRFSVFIGYLAILLPISVHCSVSCNTKRVKFFVASMTITICQSHHLTKNLKKLSITSTPAYKNQNINLKENKLIKYKAFARISIPINLLISKNKLNLLTFIMFKPP